MTSPLFLDTAKLLLNNLPRLQSESGGVEGWDLAATVDLLRRGVRETVPAMSASERSALAELLARKLKGHEGALWSRPTSDGAAAPNELLEIECMDAGLWFRASSSSFKRPPSSAAAIWARHVQDAAEERRHAVVERVLSDPARPPIAELVSAFSYHLTGVGVPSEWGRWDGKSCTGWAWVIRNVAPVTIERLLVCGADPNATDGQGRPILAYALDRKTVCSLLRHGADPLNAARPLAARHLAFASLFDVSGPMSGEASADILSLIRRSLATWPPSERQEMLEAHRLQTAETLMKPEHSIGHRGVAWMFRLACLNEWLGLPEKSLPSVEAEGQRWSLYARAIWQDLCLPKNQRAKPGSIANVWPQDDQTDGVPDVVWSWIGVFSQGASPLPAWDEAMGLPSNREAALAGLDRMLAHPQGWQGGFAFIRNLLVGRRGVAGELRDAWQTLLPDRVDRALRAAWSAPSDARRLALENAAPVLTWLASPKVQRDPRYPEWLVMALASRAQGPFATLKKNLKQALDAGWPREPLKPEVRVALEALAGVAPDAYALWEQAELARAMPEGPASAPVRSKHRL